MDGQRKPNRRGHNTAIIGEATREHILDAAERLFAEQGPEAVSVRSIAAEAKVNLGAVNYHFVSKDRLFEELFRRLVLPINEQRLKLLEECVDGAGAGAYPPLEEIIDAFVRPPLRMIAGASGSARAMVVMQFLSHSFSKPGESGFLEAYYEPVRTRFISLLRRVLPDLALEDVLWRYNYMVGCIIYAMGGPERMTRLPKGLEIGRVPRMNSDDAIEQLVTFAVAGFKAPSCVGRKPPLRQSRSRKRA
jgi:AcrR family transcriptional regulator